MCMTCLAAGLRRPCARCGGFDWVVDVYRYEEDPLRFATSLCWACLRAWYELEGHA